MVIRNVDILDSARGLWHQVEVFATRRAGGFRIRLQAGPGRIDAKRGVPFIGYFSRHIDEVDLLIRG